jgi:predicted Zn finger-like uncharacterized protein
MPFSVICPACSTRLKVPDTAIGKQVKCPKCGNLMSIAAGEPEPPPVPVVASIQATEPPPLSSAPEPEPVYDRPRPRRRAKSNTGLIIGLVAGAVILLAFCCIGGGVAIYLFRDFGGAAGGASPLSAIALANPRVTKANYARLQEGMTLADVEAILGKGAPTSAAEIRQVYSNIQTMSGPMQADGRVGVMYDRASAQGALYRWKNGGTVIFVVFTAPPSTGGKLTYRYIQEKNGTAVSAEEGGTVK